MQCGICHWVMPSYDIDEVDEAIAWIHANDDSGLAGPPTTSGTNCFLEASEQLSGPRSRLFNAIKPDA
jgi:hypothetical protein